MKEMLVLGHKGMLGQMVQNYFSKRGYTIHTLNARFNEKEKDDFIGVCCQYSDAVVVNCVGKIKQKTEDANELLWANALLPLALSTHLPESQILVHPSTDCVFDGLKGRPYSQGDRANARDVYGWSKRLGEVAVEKRPNTILFRGSIIGPDNGAYGKGLLSWFLSNEEGDQLSGYINHLWNGITTLEWCKQLENLLQNFVMGKSYFHQLGTKEHYSKYDMLMLFQKYYDTDFKIRKIETPVKIDRRLIPSLLSDNLEEQIRELVDYNL